MFDYIKIELLKIKRSKINKVIIVMPIIVCIFAFFVSVTYFTSNVYNWISLIIIHLLSSIFSSFIVNHEDKSTRFQYIDGKPREEQRKIWSAKITITQSLVLAVLILVWIITSIVYTLLGLSGYSVLNLLIGMAMIWITSLWEIPISILLTKKFNMLIVLIVNFLGGTVLGALLVQTKYWKMIPWSWPSRMLIPILYIHPNGEILQQGNRLINNFDVIYGFLAALVLYLIFRQITLKIILRKEEK